MTSLPPEAHELLAAIRDALDLPLPSIASADEREWVRLLQHRTSRARIIAGSVLLGGLDDGAAAQLRRWTAETPVTYRPWEPPGQSHTKAAEAAEGGEER